ncbi:MAG TPA: hypothetical protein DCL54_11280 [Alphaproteobacteria bacterium]|nr:hypothetical protein [Alphaproteobacteria bacterium]HAJ47148.1 hypothetical protein [Alphaproteobacteria bacterium]
MKFKFRLPSRLPYFGRGGKGASAARVAGQASKVAGKVKKSSWRGMFRWVFGMVTGGTAAVAQAADTPEPPSVEVAEETPVPQTAVMLSGTEQPAGLQGATVMSEGFHAFNDSFQLPVEPTCEEALQNYLPEVDRFFSDDFDPHPNMLLERDHDAKMLHAYDLDYREVEMKRIRSQSPKDKTVFDYIDTLVDTVMLANLHVYVDKRDDIFKNILRETRQVYFSVAIFAALIGAVLAYYLGVLSGWSAWYFGALVGLFTAFMARFGRDYALKWHIWKLQNETLLKTKRIYEEFVRDAASLLASKLSMKGREIESLMKDLKNRLDQVGDVEKRRMEQAPSLARLLLWCPLRMQLIENYYRAKFDQFMLKSARKSLEVDVSVEQAILSRRIRLSAGQIGFLVGLMVTIFVLTVAGERGTFAGMVSNTASQWLNWSTEPVSTAPAAATPPAAAANAPAAASGDDMSMDVGLFWTLAALVICMIAFFFVVGRSAMKIVPVAHKFAPEAIAHHDESLYSSGIRAGILGFMVPMIPTGLILLLGWDPIAVWSTYLGFGLVMWPYVEKEIELTDRIFKKNQHIYTSNVLRAVSRKMEATKWQRYAELRGDEKVAGVIQSVYGAWYAEVRKGRFDDTSGRR